MHYISAKQRDGPLNKFRYNAHQGDKTAFTLVVVEREPDPEHQYVLNASEIHM